MTQRTPRPGIPLVTLLVTAVLAAAVPSVADHPATVTPSELRELRAEVNRLDDAMRMVRNDNPRAQEFRDRERQIREDLQWLRDEMLKHQQDETKGLGATATEVDSLRNEIMTLRDDIDASIGPPRGQSADVDVPDGTQIQVRLEDPLSSKTARPEDRVVATVAEPVYGRDRTRPAIPAGTPVRGVIEDVQPAERPAKGGRLDVDFNSLVLGSQTVPLQATVVDMKQGGIDERRAGLGAIVGGVLGAVLDGAKGAVVGAILGGGGAVVASRGEDVVLPAGTILTVRLERPLSVARR